MRQHISATQTVFLQSPQPQVTARATPQPATPQPATPQPATTPTCSTWNILDRLNIHNDHSAKYNNSRRAVISSVIVKKRGEGGRGRGRGRGRGSRGGNPLLGLPAGRWRVSPPQTSRHDSEKFPIGRLGIRGKAAEVAGNGREEGGPYEKDNSGKEKLSATEVRQTSSLLLPRAVREIHQSSLVFWRNFARSMPAVAINHLGEYHQKCQCAVCVTISKGILNTIQKPFGIRQSCCVIHFTCPPVPPPQDRDSPCHPKPPGQHRAIQR